MTVGAQVETPAPTMYLPVFAKCVVSAPSWNLYTLVEPSVKVL